MGLTFRRPTAPPGATEAASRLDRAKSWLIPFAERYVTLLLFAVMVIVFWVLRPDTFGTLDNLRSILDQAAVIVMVSVGLTVVLAAGEFDLSFPYAIGLASAAATLMMTKYGLGATAAVIAGLVAGVVAGAISGVFVALQRASSFIVTLAIGFVWIGIADAVTGGQTIIDGFSSGFVNLTSNTLFGITIAVYIAAAFSLLTAAMLRFTVFGRYLQSIGSNPEAARIAGIGLSRIRVAAFAVLGLGVGIAAVIITSRQAQYTPDVGAGLFLQPYVAAFFGMSVLAARRFNVFGTVVGALFIGTLETGLIIVGAEDWVSNVVQGGVLLAIVLSARRARGR